jgi:outer membrane lipoprotein-sorting protein
MKSKVMLWVVLLAVTASAQLIANRKLSPDDLGAAQSEMKSAGGKDAQLVYATRLDAVTKGTFDSLVVIYSKGSDHYALVVREGKRMMLETAKGATAIKAGEQFQRMGIKYEDGKSPLIRFFSLNGGALKATDYRFNGTEFAAEGGM